MPPEEVKPEEASGLEGHGPNDDQNEDSIRRTSPPLEPLHSK